MRITAVVMLAMAALPAVPASRAAAARSTATPAVDFYDGSFECYAGPLALHLPDSYPQLLALGAHPQTADGRAQDYGSYKTVRRLISFDGLALTVFVFSNDPDRYLLSSARITRPGWSLAPLQVGASAAALFHKDWPTPPVNGSWQMDGDSSHVTITLARGHITSITYVCDMP